MHNENYVVGMHGKYVTSKSVERRRKYITTQHVC
jgi:hypothetical protein